MSEEEEVKCSDNVYDVVIIGAGYSGLSAGLYFKDCNVNNFIILEARNRVGGRVCTEYVKLDDGTTCYVDAGGAYVGPTQNRLLRIMHRFGIKTFHVNIEGQSILQYNDRLSHYSGTIPMNTPLFSLLDENCIILETNKLAKQINSCDINKSKMSKELLNKYDNMTVQQWINTIITNEEAKEHYKGIFRALLCVDPSEVSMLYWLNYVKNANGSLVHLIETEHGSQDSKIIGGSQSVCDAMQKQIDSDSKTKRVLLQHIVKTIEQNKDYITIHCNNSLSFKTKYVLCCIAPTLYKKIEWKPNLSWNRQYISERMPMGFILKTNTYFKSAFWRNDGFNGLSFNCGDNTKNENPVIATFDDCKPDGSFPSLMGFILADKARKYMEMSYEERKQSVIKQYARIFNNNKAITECIGYFEKIWHNEEYSGGCYVGTTGCNVMSQSYWKILKKPENNNIYFGGTELADQWMGYMDGAIQCGEREANKITNILSKNNKQIKIKKIFDFDKEPECDNCPLPFVNLQRSWIEQNIIPNAKNTKILCFLFIFLIVVLYLYITKF